MSLRTAHAHCLLQFYMLTHEIVARYSGQSFYNFVAGRIFAPVSMPASTYLSSVGEAAGTAVHSFTRQGRRIPTWITEADMAIAGAAGVFSSTRDLSQWMTFLLGYGAEDAKRTIPAAVIEETMSPQALDRGSNDLNITVTCGFGWGQQMHHGHRVRAPVRTQKAC
jgi:CubicO group peptidase (beta-lactamase class C family)